MRNSFRTSMGLSDLRMHFGPLVCLETFGRSHANSTQPCSRMKTVKLHVQTLDRNLEVLNPQFQPFLYQTHDGSPPNSHSKHALPQLPELLAMGACGI